MFSDRETARRVDCKESKMAPINFQLTHAICKSKLIHTSGSLLSNLVLFSDPENMIKAVKYRCDRVYKLTNALCHIYFRLQAAMFYSPLIHTLGTLHNSHIV